MPYAWDRLQLFLLARLQLFLLVNGHQGCQQEGSQRQGHKGRPEGRSWQEEVNNFSEYGASLYDEVVVLEEAKQPAVATTCNTAQAKCKEETEEPRKNHITTCVIPKSDFEKLVQITLSIWLLRSKVHRKEFRRIAC